MSCETGLRELRRLWNTELQATRAAHREVLEATPFDERVRSGMALQNLIFDDMEATGGGRRLLWFKAGKKAGLQDFQLRSGAPVLLWVPGNTRTRLRGTLVRQEADRVSVAVDEDSSFVERSPVNLDAEASEVSFERGHAAITLFLTEKALQRTGQVLFGQVPPEFEQPGSIEFRDPNLNEPQQEAIRFALSARDVALIHGPPGTGKTQVLVEVIRQLVLRGESVLGATASNAALDNLGERLLAAGLKPVRVGRVERVSDAVQDRSLERLIEETKEHQQAKQWLAQARELRSRHEKRRARGSSGPLLREADALTRDARKLFSAAQSKVLRRFRVVLSTASGVDTRILSSHRFDTVVLDEATQAPDPIALIAIARGAKVIMAGDPEQLPPTVVSLDAAREGLATTFFERLSASAPQQTTRMLTVQYRMNEALMRFPSKAHYDNRLQAAPTVALRQLTDLAGVTPDPERPLPWLFLDTAGQGWTEEQHPLTLSTANPKQAEFTAAEVRRILGRGVAPRDVAAIAPYSAQVRLLRRLLHAECEAGLEIGSVDAFQGREKEAIVYDLVRSNASREIGFLNDVRRTNVALTRAKRFLIVIGDGATLAGHAYYDALLQAAEEAGARRSVWEL